LLGPVHSHIEIADNVDIRRIAVKRYTAYNNPMAVTGTGPELDSDVHLTR
jgi:hypothetical protein